MAPGVFSPSFRPIQRQAVQGRHRGSHRSSSHHHIYLYKTMSTSATSLLAFLRRRNCWCGAGPQTSPCTGPDAKVATTYMPHGAERREQSEKNRAGSPAIDFANFGKSRSSSTSSKLASCQDLRLHSYIPVPCNYWGYCHLASVTAVDPLCVVLPFRKCVRNNMEYETGLFTHASLCPIDVVTDSLNSKKRGVA